MRDIRFRSDPLGSTREHWIQHHASPIWRLWKYDDPEYLPFMTGANLDNVAANRHHPSVLIWSLGNESRWSPLWEEVNRAIKSADPKRPTCFHDQCWGGFNNAGSRAEILPDQYNTLDPVVITRSYSECPGEMYTATVQLEAS